MVPVVQQKRSTYIEQLISSGISKVSVFLGQGTMNPSVERVRSIGQNPLVYGAPHLKSLKGIAQRSDTSGIVHNILKYQLDRNCMTSVRHLTHILAVAQALETESRSVHDEKRGRQHAQFLTQMSQAFMSGMALLEINGTAQGYIRQQLLEGLNSVLDCLVDRDDDNVAAKRAVLEDIGVHSAKSYHQEADLIQCLQRAFDFKLAAEDKAVSDIDKMLYLEDAAVAFLAAWSVLEHDPESATEALTEVLKDQIEYIVH